MRKTKFTRLVILLIAIVMVIGMTTMAVIASAISGEEARVFLDGRRIRNIDAYIDRHDEIRVSDVDELYSVLPDLEEEVYVRPGKDDGYVVIDYLKYVNYYYEQDGNRLYLYTDEYYWKEVVDIDDLDEEKEAELYVNGMYIKTSDIYVSKESEVYLIGYDDLYRLFPEETEDIDFPSNHRVTNLKDWAKRYDYELHLLGENVFLNNDGRTPVEVRSDGIRVDFPDQQPILEDNGCFIPVASIAEVKGYEVKWDKKNNKIVITGNDKEVVLYPNSQVYWLNGREYEMDRPYVLNGRTLVSIYFISQVFQCSVSAEMENDVYIINLSSGW